MSTRSRLPSLGPRGEGWVAIQVLLFGLVFVADTAAGGSSSGPVAAVGSGAVLAGLAVVAAGLWWLRAGRALTAVPHPLATASLVDTGPYRFVRHPIYAGIVLAALGAGVARASWAGIAAAVVLFAFFDLKRRREEAWLVERVAGYEGYRQRVRALVPFLY